MFALFACLFLLFLNGFFVAAEFALVRVRVSQLEVLKEEGDKAAARVIKIVHELDSYLSAVQLGITVASLGIGALAEPAINKYLTMFFTWLDLGIPADVIHGLSYVLAFSVASFLHIVCGELAPKSLAIAKPLEVSKFVSRPMYIFHLLFGPIMYLLVATSNALLRLFKIEPVAGDHSAGVSAEELLNIAQHSSNDGTITKEQGTLVENVFHFSSLSAKEVMVPRGMIDAINVNASIDEFLTMALSKGHSRYPVYRNDIDDIVGLVHIKDVFAARQSNDDVMLKDLLRDIVYIPETSNIGQVMKIFQEKRSHLAVVVDEYGGTSGILTMEDSLEKLVGDIEDEFDEEEEDEIEARDGGWKVLGETPLSELTETLGLREIKAESDVLSGFIMELLGRVAKTGDIVEYQGYTLEVVEMDRLRIAEVFVKKSVPADKGSKSDGRVSATTQKVDLSAKKERKDPREKLL